MRKFFNHLRGAVQSCFDRWWPAETPAPPPEPPLGTSVVGPLSRAILTDGVCRALFEQYAEHRAGERGAEETGWALVGLRQADDAVILAALPAGAAREAGIAHVRFNADAQALASRILRQSDRRLSLLGIVHTHPGSLRHPSQGDFEGDRNWVRLLRGGEGLFGIGTADAPETASSELVADQPKPQVQTWLGLRFTWYALGMGDDQYRPLPVRLTLGPDLAAPLQTIWSIIEEHAVRLERLCQRLAKIRFDVLLAPAALQLSVGLDPGRRLAVRLTEKNVTYGELKGEAWTPLPERDPHPDHGLFQLLAGLSEEKRA